MNAKVPCQISLGNNEKEISTLLHKYDYYWPADKIVTKHNSSQFTWKYLNIKVKNRVSLCVTSCYDCDTGCTSRTSQNYSSEEILPYLERMLKNAKDNRS
jgi:hypothetical protein